MKTLPFIALAALVQAYAADITGKWKSEFDTQIGHLKYTYELKADGEKITGKALRELEGTKTTIDLVEGKIKGDEVSFVEPIKVQEQEIRIEYKGKLEIRNSLLNVVLCDTPEIRKNDASKGPR